MGVDKVDGLGFIQVKCLFDQIRITMYPQSQHSGKKGRGDRETYGMTLMNGSNGDMPLINDA